LGAADAAAMSDAIRRERIPRDSDALIAARRRRQNAVAAVGEAKPMAKAAAAIERRVEAREPEAPQERVSDVLNAFRREYDALTEHQQLRFERIVKRYALGRVSVDEWVRVIRSLRQAIGRHCGPSRRRAGGG
jgi:hypothetical protein